MNLNMEQQQKLTQSATQERTLPPSIYHPIKTTDVSKELGEAYRSAKNFYEQGEFQQVIDTLENEVLSTTSSIQFEAYLLAALATSNLDNATESFDFLKQAGRLTAARHPDNQNKLKDTKASILEHFGNWLDAVSLRMDLTYNLPLNEGEDNQTKLWLAVQNLTQNEIDELYQQQRPLLNGWLTISGILRNQSLSIEQQLTVFENWRIENPNHPAALSPPQDFQIMSSIEDMAPKKIVLMLPMSGKLERASQAIVDGFFATFYNQKEARPQVSIINVDDYSNIIDALAAANEKQPDVIIGPLQKNNVAQVGRLDLPYPVIALNQLDINLHPKNLYHFSLSAEDEIHELITFAKQEGATKAAILNIQDTWALKQSDEFRVAATKENITITSNQSYANTPKGRQDAIQKLLLIDESYARKRRIEQWTGTKVESIARSREDLDYVFYVGKLNDAKQIRPLIDFYFADKIPMLATSTLNDSEPDKSINPSDIERILFTEVPALTPNSTTLDVLPKNQSSNILRRLQALGADSYLLANKYRLFTLLPSTKISANTGIITIDENGIFHKRPEIMTYRKGNLVYANNHPYFQQQENTEK
ncbi:penicillin-binding protein activator [Marinomonas primoryensis]|uniref:Penicillin-binding protein activator n=1 Tax=Marinomonas primoryensis TaxID=178399 RepID=A0A859CVI4_9GAMM|nr:penicillin-binding protein activator [Marinomonas primoryensis]QKK80496.1 penicillin-binding protein activator [Marinomonas primoryensis]